MQIKGLPALLHAVEAAAESRLPTVQTMNSMFSKEFESIAFEGAGFTISGSELSGAKPGLSPHAIEVLPTCPRCLSCPVQAWLVCRYVRSSPSWASWSASAPTVS